MCLRLAAIGSMVAWLAFGSVSLQAQPGVTRTTQFASDGKTIASSSTSVIDIWDVADGRLLRKMQGHANFVNALAMTPDGRVLASGSYDCTARLWDARNGKELHLLKGAEKAIAFIAISADSKMLAAGGYDKVIWIWDIATGKEIRRLSGSQGEIGGLMASLAQAEGVYVKLSASMLTLPPNLVSSKTPIPQAPSIMDRDIAFRQTA